MKKICKTILVTLLVAVFAATLAIGLAACDPDSTNPDTLQTLRFAAPDGTPALAMLRPASEKQKIGDYSVEYEVVQPANIAQEMGAAKADIVIMPVNAGATQIVSKGADYKLVSIAVEGSLYLVGHKEPVDGAVAAITIGDLAAKRIACIGETGVPGLVFKYVMKANGLTIVTDEAKKESLAPDEVFVDYVGDGAKAAEAYYKGDVDFIVVGEPAATAQKVKANTFTQADAQYARRLNAEMNMQYEYGKVSGLSDVDNYPQAGLFVKSSLAANSKFMHALFDALDANKEWISQYANKVTEVAQGIGSTSTFPAPAIDRCALDCDDIDSESADEIIKFLENVTGQNIWEAKKDVIFALDLDA